MSTICLNMIVKNEAAIIAETLANIVAHIHIDYWVIADTGSSDDTRAIIQQFFAQRGIPGQLLQHPWQNFGHNRQLALEAAQGQTDYVFFFDADDRFEGRFALPEHLESTFYNLYLTNAAKATRYPRRLLAKNDGSVMWMGVLHEIIMPKANVQAQESYIEGDYHVVSGRFGARNQDPDKYLKDAQMLEQAFGPENNLMLKRRYAYYCGQSYRDCNRPDLAAVWLERNIELCDKTGEEVRFSYIALGTEYNKLNNFTKATEAWWLAYNAAPQHAEALGLLAQTYYNLGQYQLGFDAAQKAVTLPAPDPLKTLFVNEVLHRYGIWYDLTRNAVKLQRWDEAYQGAKHLLAQPELNAELNAFLISVLHALKGLMEQDSLAQTKHTYQRLQQWQHITPESQATRTQLLAWLQHYITS